MTRSNGVKARAQKPKTREQSLREKRERIKAASVAGGPQLRTASVVSVRTSAKAKPRNRKRDALEKVVVRSISKEWAEDFEIDGAFDFLFESEAIVEDDEVVYGDSLKDQEIKLGKALYQEYKDAQAFMRGEVSWL